jgi:ABC-type bacteriocin/lantibiotic exporter with double-glycine peptidase domain
MGLPKRNDSDEASKTEQKPSLLRFQNLKKAAVNVTKDAFDFCFESIEQKSNRMFDNYQEKTVNLAKTVVRDQEEFLSTAETTARDVVKTIFKNVEVSLDLVMARVLSILVSISMVYIAVFTNASYESDGWRVLRILVTFYLMTIIFGAFVRIFRWIWNFDYALKEFMKWQFYTGLLTFFAIITYGITETGLWIFEYALRHLT